MTTYNLLEEPWIPCRFPGEPAPRSLGLREVLFRAHEIREVVGHSPLATMGIHRLLLAILHGVFGPENKKAWRGLRGAGRFDAGALEAYFERWRPRFDLFDRKRPFYQVAELDPRCAGPMAKLFHERASGNNAVLFDHSRDDREAQVPMALAAQQLLVHQALSFGGMVSYQPEEDPKLHKFAKAGPLVKCALFLVGGASLHETLVRNMVAYAPEHEKPFAAKGPDLPAWERDEAPGVESRAPGGLLDLLTWQSRRIRLFPAEDGAPVVTKVAVVKGESFPEGYGLYLKDPHLAFQKNLFMKEGAPWFSVGFREGRALWRDSLVLMPAVVERSARPPILDWLADAEEEDAPLAYDLRAIGLASDQAKAEFWRMEAIAWPLAYLHAGPNLHGALQRALELAERVAGLLGGGYGDLPGGKKGPTGLRVLVEAIQGASKSIKASADGLGAERAFWPLVEGPFARLLAELPEDRREDDDLTLYGERLLPIWVEELRDAAREAFDFATSGFAGKARNLKALSLAESAFERQLLHQLGPRAPRLAQPGSRPPQEASA